MRKPYPTDLSDFGSSRRASSAGSIMMVGKGCLPGKAREGGASHMRRTARWLAPLALTLLLCRGVAGRRERCLVMADERPDWRYAIGRLRGIVSPPVEITPPPPGIRFEHDVEVAVSDGTILRVNVFRPESEGRYPVIMCAHPYGKDRLPKRGPLGYR